MRESFWAGECLRLYGLLVLFVLGSRLGIRVSGEDGAGRWVVRLFALFAAARALGYV